MSIAAIYAPQLEHLLKGAVPPAAPTAAAAPSSGGGGFFSKARNFVTGGGASTTAPSNTAATSPVHQGQPKPRDEAALALVSDLLTAVSTLYHELDAIRTAEKESTRSQKAANKQKAAPAAPPTAAAPDDAFSMFATAAAPPPAAPSRTSLPPAGPPAVPVSEGGGGSKSSFFLEKEKEERAFVQALPGLIEQLCCLASGASSSSLSPQFQSPSSATATAASEKPVPGPLCGLSTAAVCYAITVLSSLAVQHGAVVSKAVEAVGDALKDSVRTGDRRSIAGASRAGAALIIGADPSIFDGMNSPFVEGFADAFPVDVAQVNDSNDHRRDGTSVVDLVQSIFAKRRGLQSGNNATAAGANQSRGSMRTIASSLMDAAIPAFKVLTTKPRDVGAKCALVELLGECLVTLYCPVLPAQSTASAHDGRRGDAPRRQDDGAGDNEENGKIRELYRIFDVVVSADDRRSSRSASTGQPSQVSGMDGSVLSLPPMPLPAVKPLLKVLTDPQLPPDSPARECAASAIARLFSPQFFSAASSKVSKLSTAPTHARFEMENSAFGFGAPVAVANQGHHILRNVSCMVAPPLLPDDVVKACRAAAISVLAQTVSHAASPKAFGSATPIGNLPPGGDAFVSVFTGSLATSLGPFLALFVPLPQLVRKIVQEAIACAPYAQASLDPHRTSSATKPAATVTGGMYSTSLRALGAATIAAHMASPFSGGGAVFLSVWHVCSSEAIHQTFQQSSTSGGGGFLGSWGIGGGKSGAAQAALATPSFTTGHAEPSGASTALLLAVQVVADAAHVYAAHYCRGEGERSFFMQWLLHVAQHPLDDAGGKTARSSESAQQTTKTARERFLEKEREEARKAAAEGDDPASALEASARSEPAPSTGSPKASSVSKTPGEKSHLVGQDGKMTLPPLSKGLLDAAATAASQQFPMAHFPKVLEASHAAAIAAVCGVNYGSTDGASHFVTALFGAGGELAEAAKATWRGRSRENNTATKLQVLEDDDEEAASKSDAIATELAGNAWAVPAPSLFEILAGNHGAAAVLGGAQSAVAGFASQFTTTSYVECLALVAVAALSSVLAVSSSLHRKVIDHVANASCGFLLKHLSASEPTLQSSTPSSSSHTQQGSGGGGGGGAAAQSAASPGGSQSTLSSTPVGSEAPTPNGGGAMVVGAGAHHVDPSHGSVAGASVAKKAQLPLLSSSAIVAASRLAAVTAPFVASSLSALVATAEGSNNPVLLAQAALVLGPAASLPSYAGATPSFDATELSTSFTVLAEALAKRAGAPSPVPELALEFHGGDSSSPLHGSPFYDTIAPFGPALLRAAASWSTKLTCEVGQQHQRTASGASDVGSFVMANAAAAAVAPPLACAFIIARVALTSHLLQKTKHEAQSVQTARAERSALAAFVDELQQHSKTTTTATAHPQSALDALDGSIDNSGQPGRHINGAAVTTPSTTAPSLVLDQTSLATIADAVAVALANHATFPAVAVRAACEVAPLLRHCGARLHFSLSTPADVSARASVGPTLVSPPSAAVTLGTMQFQQGACHNAAAGVTIPPQPPAVHAQQLSLASPTVAAAFSDLRAFIASVVLPNPSSSSEVSSPSAVTGTWDGCNDFDPLFNHEAKQPQRKLLTVSDRTSGVVGRVSPPKRDYSACPVAFGTEDALPWLPHEAVLALPSDLASTAAASEEHQREVAAWESWKAALIQLLSIERDHGNSASANTGDQQDVETLVKVKELLRTADLTRSPVSSTDLKSSTDALERLCRGTAAENDPALGEPSTVVPPSQQLDEVKNFDGHFLSLLGVSESGAESSPSSVQQRSLQSAVAVIARMFAMGDAALLAVAFDPTGASRSRHASSSPNTAAATIAVPGSLGASTSDHPHDSAAPTPKATGDKPGASYAARRQCLMKIFDILYESDGAASTKASTAVAATGPSSAVPSACAAHVLPMSMAERRRKTVHWNVTVLLHKIVDECAAVRREVLRGHAHYAAFAAASSPPPSAHNGSASESSDKSTAALEKVVQIAGLTTTMSTATSDVLSMDPNAATALFQESARLSELIATLRKQLTAVFLPSIYPAVRHVAASALARLPEIPGASAEATSLATLTSGAISGTGVAPATKHGVALALALWASAQNDARSAAMNRRSLFFNLTGQHVAQAALSALQKEIATAQHHGDAAAAAADADPFGFDTVLPAQVVTAPPLAPLAPPSPTSSSFAPLVFSYSANALRGTTQDVASAAGGDAHSKAAAAAQIRAATAVVLSAGAKQATAAETAIATQYKIAGVSSSVAAAPPRSATATAGGAVDEQWSVAVSKSLAGLTASPALAPKPTSSHRCVSSAVSDALRRLCISSTSSSVGLRGGGGGGGGGDKASPSTSGALLAVAFDRLWLQRSVPLNGASLRTIDEAALSKIVSKLSSVKASASGNCMVVDPHTVDSNAFARLLCTTDLLLSIFAGAPVPAGGKRLPSAPPGSAAASSGLLPATVASALIEVTATPSDSRRGGAATETGPAVGAKAYDDDEGGGVAALGLAAAAENRRGDNASRTTATAEQGNGSANNFGFDMYLAMADSVITTSSSAGPTPQQKAVLSGSGSVNGGAGTGGGRDDDTFAAFVASGPAVATPRPPAQKSPAASLVSALEAIEKSSVSVPIEVSTSGPLRCIACEGLVVVVESIHASVTTLLSSRNRGHDQTTSQDTEAKIAASLVLVEKIGAAFRSMLQRGIGSAHPSVAASILASVARIINPSSVKGASTPALTRALRRDDSAVTDGEEEKAASQMIRRVLMSSLCLRPVLVHAATTALSLSAEHPGIVSVERCVLPFLRSVLPRASGDVDQDRQFVLNDADVAHIVRAAAAAEAALSHSPYSPSYLSFVIGAVSSSSFATTFEGVDSIAEIHGVAPPRPKSTDTTAERASGKKHGPHSIYHPLGSQAWCSFESTAGRGAASSKIGGSRGKEGGAKWIMETVVPSISQTTAKTRAADPRDLLCKFSKEAAAAIALNTDRNAEEPVPYSSAVVVEYLRLRAVQDSVRGVWDDATALQDTSFFPAVPAADSDTTEHVDAIVAAVMDEQNRGSHFDLAFVAHMLLAVYSDTVVAQHRQASLSQQRQASHARARSQSPTPGSTIPGSPSGGSLQSNNTSFGRRPNGGCLPTVTTLSRRKARPISDPAMLGVVASVALTLSFGHQRRGGRRDGNGVRQTNGHKNEIAMDSDNDMMVMDTMKTALFVAGVIRHVRPLFDDGARLCIEATIHRLITETAKTTTDESVSSKIGLCAIAGALSSGVDSSTGASAILRALCDGHQTNTQKTAVPMFPLQATVTLSLASTLSDAVRACQIALPATADRSHGTALVTVDLARHVAAALARSTESSSSEQSRALGDGELLSQFLSGVAPVRGDAAVTAPSPLLVIAGLFSLAPGHAVKPGASVSPSLSAAFVSALSAVLFGTESSKHHVKVTTGGGESEETVQRASLVTELAASCARSNAGLAYFGALLLRILAIAPTLRSADGSSASAVVAKAILRLAAAAAADQDSQTSEEQTSGVNGQGTIEGWMTVEERRQWRITAVLTLVAMVANAAEKPCRDLIPPVVARIAALAPTEARAAVAQLPPELSTAMREASVAKPPPQSTTVPTAPPPAQAAQPPAQARPTSQPGAPSPAGGGLGFSAAAFALPTTEPKPKPQKPTLAFSAAAFQ